MRAAELLNSLSQTLKNFILGLLTSHTKYRFSESVRMISPMLEEGNEGYCQGVEHAPVKTPSNFHKLPNELLAEIFAHCLQDLQRAAPHRNFSPLLPSSVCKHWRQVALSTPSLWSRIAINVTQYTCSPTAQQLKTWLSRSASSPLSVMMVIHPAEFGLIEETHRSYPDAVEALAILVEQVDRWKQVILCIPSSFQPMLMATQTNSMPLLERLDLTVDYPVELNDSKTNIDVNKILPHSRRLTQLSWLAKGPLFISENRESWSRLTHLQIGSAVNLTFCHNVLGACPLLQTCAFSSVQLDGDGDRMSHLHHKFLQSLVINGPIEPRHLLANLTAPALRSLKLTHSSERSNPPNSNQTLPGFISRSACPLEELVIENAALQEDELHTILELVSQTLLVLDIWEDCESAYIFGTSMWSVEGIASCMSRRVLGALIASDNATGIGASSPWCPQLKVFKYRGAISAPDGMFGNTVSSRWSSESVRSGTVARLKTVHAEFKTHRPMDALRLRQLKSEGMECKVFML